MQIHAGPGRPSSAAAPALAARLRRKLLVLWRSLTGYRQSEQVLGEEANRFWAQACTTPAAARAEESHWRGAGAFADDALWLRLGREHHQMLLDSLRRHGLPLQARRVVEWGCGGGMNAVHFARGTDQFYGVDISPASLQECARQLARESLPGFVPVLVDANAPQSALAQIGAPCDWFICTYVVELLPSEAHALALLDTAHALLRAGGVALVQLRISRGGWLARSRPWDYAANMAHNVRFTRSAFAAACGARGFRVLDVLDQGAVPELREKDYAVFVLQR